MKILIINGPNLNLLGRREPEVYGHKAFEPYFEELVRAFPQAQLQYVQSNCEGAIIDALHEAFIGPKELRADAVILNAGAYTHYSYAIADAISAIAPLPVVEVHISQPAAREEFRHKSVIASVCHGSICGFGLDSYWLAILALLRIGCHVS
ncbi:MAG: 3-dehydroquinate dehydratase [Muribaculaceae bacterium]|nr:3-dehydroquinate dehydratase [Muribaculaceae bacterium]